jgi:hypothetical protein
VGVVDHKQQRLSSGRHRKQAHEPGENREAIAGSRLCRRERERGADGCRLRLGELGEVIQERGDELAKRRKGQVCFRLDADGHGHLHAGGAPARLREQRGLADPRVPDQREGSPPARPRPGKYGLDAAELPLTSYEHATATLPSTQRSN